MIDLRPRLWCVTELYWPEQGTAAHLLTQTAEGLAADFDVHVLCGQPDYFESGRQAPAREQHNGTRIFRVRGTRFGSRNILARLVDALSFTLVIFFFALRHFRKGDRILAATNPPPLPLVIGLAAKIRGCRSTLLVHDVYPEVLSAAGALRRNSLPYRILDFVFGRSYAMYDRFVVLGECMKHVVQTKLGKQVRPIAVIPNWADCDIVPIDRAANGFCVEHGLTDKFIVQFSGNFGRTHDIELLLQAAEILADFPDIIFLLVGAGAKTKLIDGKEEEAGNVLFLPRQPRERLGEMLAASDATVISFIDGMLGLSVPSRMYNVMAAGVPIIASAHQESELVREIKAAESGWALQHANAEELAQLLRTLASAEGRGEGRRRGANAREAVMSRYLAHHAIALYRQAMA
jgi:glycosyltransferase involved in cell wall biosynthesis